MLETLKIEKSIKFNKENQTLKIRNLITNYFLQNINVYLFTFCLSMTNFFEKALFLNYASLKPRTSSF